MFVTKHTRFVGLAKAYQNEGEVMGLGKLAQVLALVAAPLAPGNVISTRVFLLGATFASASLLGACGGSGSDSGAAPNPVVPSASVVQVTPQVDAPMTGPSALRIVETLSLLEVRPAGKALKVSSLQGTPVFALDAAGQVALASILTGSSVSFTANSTASLLASMALSRDLPDKTVAELRMAIESAADFPALTAAIALAVSAGRNPLDQGAVKDRFAIVLQQAGASLMASASGVRSQPQAVARARVPYAGERSQPKAVGEPRVPFSLSPTLFTTRFDRVHLSKSLNYQSEVVVQNSSRLAFNVSLLNVAGQEQTEPKPLEATKHFFGVIESPFLSEAKLSRTFLGAFSVKVQPDNQRNYIEALKAAMLGISPPGAAAVKTCVDTVTEAATIAGIDAVVGSQNLPKLVKDTILNLGSATPGLLLDCGIPVFLPELLVIYEGLLKVTDAVGLGALLAEMEHVGLDAKLNGVCVSPSQILISCVHRMEVERQPAPMQPLAVQRISIKFKDKDGNDTVPYGIKILPTDPTVLDLDETRSVLSSGIKEGFAAVTLFDPATDKSLQIGVNVTRGKFDKTNYVVSAGSTAEIRVVDPVTGEDVHRGVGFQALMADQTYGRVVVPEGPIAPLQFVANSVPTPTPQNLRGYVTGDDKFFASTITVTGTTAFWEGTFTYNECIAPGYAGSGDACNYAAFPAGGNASSNTGRLLARLGSSEAGNLRWNYSVGGSSQLELCSASGSGVDIATTDTFTRPIDLAATFYNTGSSIPANMVFAVTMRTATRISGTFSVAFTYPAFGATISSPYVQTPGVAKGVWSISPRGTSFPKCTYPAPADYCLAGNYAWFQGGGGDGSSRIVGSCDWRLPDSPGRTDEWAGLR